MADTPTNALDQVITIKAEGQLPGEGLGIALINFRIKLLEWMTPDQRAAALTRLDHIEQFVDDLGAPLRNLAAKLREVGK